jgi:indole-3-glycerol phosphate synthase
MFLDKVAAATRERIEQSKAGRSEQALRELCLDSSPSPSLSQALARGPNEGMRVIAEVKRASPSRGPIRPDLVLEDLVSSYVRGGASAISVLTEPDFFEGDLSDIGRAREITSLPILRKDFIIDGYQLLESRAAGASAVLLIVALLEQEMLASLLEEGHEIGLEALVEVHDEAELEAALEAGAEIVGINNRDLKTLQVDLGTTLRLAPQVPSGRVLVSESGYSRRDDVVTALQAGVHAILVGEALVRSEGPEELIAELKGERPEGLITKLRAEMPEELINDLRGNNHGPG